MKIVKLIQSKEGKVHFIRWALLETRWFNIYLHLIMRADEDEHPHNHPFNFMSIILSGGYREELIEFNKDGMFRFCDSVFKKPFSVLFRSRQTYHQLVELKEPTLTLVVTGKRGLHWGYLVNGNLIGHREYRRRKHAEL